MAVGNHARGREKRFPADRIIDKIKRHRLAALVIVAGTIIIAVGSFVGALTKIAEFIDRPGDPRPVTAKEIQETIKRTAIELKEEFESVTSRSGKAPPISNSDFAQVDRLIARIERLDPGNGHAIYYKGFEVRWKGQRFASHPTLFLYLERAKNAHLAGDNGDASFCFDNWQGYCKQRQAFINHFLALDFEQAAKGEPNPAVAVARLKAGLERAEIAIRIYGEFNAPGQGTPTRTLVESLRKQITDKANLRNGG